MNKVNTNSETIIDESGIELIVGYEYQKDNGYYEEPGNVASFVEPMVETTLRSVEIVIAGIGIDILPKMNDNQKMEIISLLTYE